MVDKTLSAADLPRLVVQLPDGREVHHAVVGTELTIGRDPSNRIAIPDQFVSKFHAKLLASGSSLTLVDLGSANKTYVNGQPVTQMPVKFGDELQFAGVRCRLLAPENQGQGVPAQPAKPAPKSASPPPPAAAKPAAARRPAPAGRPKAPAAPSAGSVAQPAPAAPGRSAPPPIEADPMKRLLRIGGLLILVSLALGVLLRVLLVPGRAPEPGSGTGDGTAATTSAPAQAGASSTTTAPPPTPSGNPGQAGSAEAWFDQALSYLDTGRLKEAQTAFRKVLEIDPDNTRAKTRLSLLEEEIAKKAEAHFGNARQAFQFLRYEEAIAEWEMFLTLADASDVRYVEAQQGIEQAKAKLR